MPKLTLNSVVGILIVTAIFGSVIYVYFIKEKFDFDKNGVENIGIVVSDQQNSTSAPKFKHQVNGKEYVGTYVAQLPGLTIGEVFPLRYNPDNPREILVDLWEPLFLPNELISETVGEITCVSEVKFGSPRPAVCFEYVADDETVNRLQELPMNYKTQFPKLIVGQRYEVDYWKENPKRAIIYLDKPVE